MVMAKAIWNEAVLAQSDEYEMVEGNVYFPVDKINFPPSLTRHIGCRLTPTRRGWFWPRVTASPWMWKAPRHPGLCWQ